jgi:hypothetical protein
MAIKKISYGYKCIFAFKHSSDDFFQAAEALLEKGIFFGPVIVLSFAAFESCCKRIIRCLLQRIDGKTLAESDNYLKNKVVGSPVKGNLPTVILKEFKRLCGSDLENEIKKLPFWHFIEKDLCEWRNKIIHTGFISGKVPTLEQARKSLESAKEVSYFLEKKILRQKGN